jgi:hypothetical protein
VHVFVQAVLNLCETLRKDSTQSVHLEVQNYGRFSGTDETSPSASNVVKKASNIKRKTSKQNPGKMSHGYIVCRMCNVRVIGILCILKRGFKITMQLCGE